MMGKFVLPADYSKDNSAKTPKECITILWTIIAGEVKLRQRSCRRQVRLRRDRFACGEQSHRGTACRVFSKISLSFFHTITALVCIFQEFYKMYLRRHHVLLLLDLFVSVFSVDILSELTKLINVWPGQGLGGLSLVNTASPPFWLIRNRGIARLP